MSNKKEWLLTLYQSNPINKNITFSYPSFYQELGKVIKGKCNNYKIESINNKKISYIPSEIEDLYRWRIIVNKIDNNNNYIVLMSIRPEKNTSIKQQLTKPECENLLNEGLKIIQKLGDILIINYQNTSVELRRLSYSESNILDISEWKVVLTDERSMLFKYFIRNGINKVYDILRNTNNTKINFKLVTKFISNNNIKEKIKNKLKDYGNVKEIKDYEYNLPQNEDQNTVYIIPLDEHNANQQTITDTKEFFIPRKLIFQHISRFDRLDNQYSFNNMLCEILTKIGLCSFYIEPSYIIGNIDSFIFINDIYNENKKTRLLEVIYTFSSLRDISRERLLLFAANEIPFRSYKDNIIFTEPKRLASRITETGKLVNGMKIVLIFTKRPGLNNCETITKSFKELNINVERIYYIPSRWIRFIDEYILDPLDECKHPYLILTERLAVLKPSTNLAIYPQLFSLPIELLYPLNIKISENDLIKILWLIKKRLYRYHNIKTLSLPEPIAIWRKNRTFLLYTQQRDIQLRYLI
jgi:ribosomal protein L30E